MISFVNSMRSSAVLALLAAVPAYAAVPFPTPQYSMSYAIGASYTSFGASDSYYHDGALPIEFGLYSGQSIYGSTRVSVSGAHGGVVTTSGSGYYYGDGFIDDDGSYIEQSFTTISGFASVNYTVTVNGPAGEFAPYRVTAIGSTSAYAYDDFSRAFTHAAFVIEDLAGMFVGGFDITSASDQAFYFPDQNVNFDQIVSLRGGSQYNIFLLSEFEVSGAAETSGYVDPVFTVDPAYASRFSLLGVPGVPVVVPSTVPEPASWGLMVVGFGLIGAMRRRAVSAVAV